MIVHWRYAPETLTKYVYIPLSVETIYAINTIIYLFIYLFIFSWQREIEKQGNEITEQLQLLFKYCQGAAHIWDVHEVGL